MRYGGQLLLPGRESGVSADSVNSNRSHYSNYSQASQLSKKKKFQVSHTHEKSFKSPIHSNKNQAFSEYGCALPPPQKKHSAIKPKLLITPTPPRKNLYLSQKQTSITPTPSFNIAT